MARQAVDLEALHPDREDADTTDADLRLHELVPQHRDGEALPGVLTGASRESRSAPIFFRRPPDRDKFYGVDDLPDLAVRDGRWKLLCEYDGSDPMLFDLAKDRGETENLASREPEVVARLKAAVLAWHNSMPPQGG